MPIDSNVAKTKAQAFAEKFNGDENLKDSDRWQKFFKTRNGLIFKILCEESTSVNLETACQRRDTTLKKF